MFISIMASTHPMDEIDYSLFGAIASTSSNDVPDAGDDEFVDNLIDESCGSADTVEEKSDLDCPAGSENARYFFTKQNPIYCAVVISISGTALFYNLRST